MLSTAAYNSYFQVNAFLLFLSFTISWKGLRDDLTFLLEEELSHIQLCSLHQEMRNTEQLLGSLGLFTHSVGCLDKCNESLANYGPENTRAWDRIRVNLRPGQQTDVTRSNIKVSSMSGCVYFLSINLSILYFGAINCRC